MLLALFKINEMRKILIGLIVISLIYSCNSENKKNTVSTDTQSKYKISQYLNNCKSKEDINSNSKIAIDSMKTYKLRFSSGWDVENVIEKDLKGIYAFDTASFLQTELIRTITVSQSIIEKKKSLNNYFLSELKGMEDEGFSIKETGTYDLNNSDARWVLTSTGTKKKSYSIFIYTMKYSLNSVFIIELNVENTDKPEVELCRLKSIIDSFIFLPLNKAA